MSEKNPLYDEDDPRGTVYSESTEDPYAEPDHHDPASGHYPDRKDQREQYGPHTCQECNTEIPEAWDRCGDCVCATSNTRRPWLPDEPDQTENDQETPDWTFGRVVFAIVPASTRYKALALGSSAFTLADSEALLGEASARHRDVKPVTDFEASPARHLTAGWGNLVDVAPLESDDGVRLFDAAVERTLKESGPETHLYLMEGDPLTTQEEVGALQGQMVVSDEEYWIIPGIVRRYKFDPDCAIPDSDSEALECRECGEVTAHQYTGKSTLDGERGWPVWVCTQCETPRFGHEQGDLPSNELIEDFVDGWRNGRVNLHDQVMRAYREKNGLYPWRN